MKLLINILFIITILNSCTLDNNKQIVNSLVEKKENIKVNLIKKIEKKKTIDEKKKTIDEKKKTIDEQKKTNDSDNNFPIYYIGEKYFIDGVAYIPKEDYNYSENGLATFYDKELHNHKTINNDLNKVTELLGRHKTLPLPSVVKVTNLENGLSVIIKVNDRNENNVSIIEVSRKVAQLLRFYKSKIARVRVEVLTDPSKQLKIVTKSMNDPNFNTLIDSSPTEEVLITDLNETIDYQNESEYKFEQPIELGFEKVLESNLFVKIDGFTSYNNAQDIIASLKNNYKTTIQNEGSSYSIIFETLNNLEANKLVQLLISKGYKNANIVIK